MIFHRWNPGIDMEASIQIVRYQEVGLRKIRKRDWDRRRLGLVESRGSIFGSGRERSNSWRKSSIPSIRIWISVIFKAISQIFRAMGSVNLKIRFWKIETKYKGINRRFPHTISQLIGMAGDGKNGQGNRKRLKISVPHFDNSEIIKNYSKTLVGTGMNPVKQDIKALIVMLPKIWKIEDRVAGVDLGHGKFQFDFEMEEDIEVVLRMQPYHFDYWMIALARWQPKKAHNFPAEILFWVRVVGVPLEFWAAPSFESIGDAIGRTKEVDLDFGRVKAVIDGFKELSFETV
ncbi:unnamed protein product [Brassica oleracea]